MYISNISANELARDIESELKLAPSTPAGTFASIINSVEQLLYSEIVREIRETKCERKGGVLNLSEITVLDGEDKVRASDVTRVTFRSDGKNDHPFELIRQNEDDVWFMYDRPSFIPHSPDIIKINLGTIEGIDESAFTVFYIVRPAPKYVINDRICPDVICLPDEFILLMSARIRGELCKLMGDDNQAAKWLNDYNTYLDDFVSFIGRRGRL